MDRGPGAAVGLMNRFLRLFFEYFYHQFAWTYDFVAALVSVGRWNRWILAAVPYLAGRDILEVGCGPGHLQAHLLTNRALRVAGLDESRQMIVLAKRRVIRQGLGHFKLVRGRAQAVPFPSGCFDTVVSTFPSEYIFDADTLAEIHRIVRPGGRFVVVPAAWILGKALTDRAAAWLFKVTHQSPPSAGDLFGKQLEGRLRRAGFEPHFTTIELESSQVYLVNAHRAEIAPQAAITGAGPGQWPLDPSDGMH